mmetsp:Transcript_81926/g.240496  ORF Transcript_81926/g.240496 Transcript_81926/m.240496 type:complete len:243 (-) Transcript_81926:1002-1730(-)
MWAASVRSLRPRDVCSSVLPSEKRKHPKPRSVPHLLACRSAVCAAPGTACASSCACCFSRHSRASVMTSSAITSPTVHGNPPGHWAATRRMPCVSIESRPVAPRVYERPAFSSTVQPHVSRGESLSDEGTPAVPKECISRSAADLLDVSYSARAAYSNSSSDSVWSCSSLRACSRDHAAAAALRRVNSSPAAVRSSAVQAWRLMAERGELTTSGGGKGSDEDGTRMYSVATAWLLQLVFTST